MVPWSFNLTCTTSLRSKRGTSILVVYSESWYASFHSFPLQRMLTCVLPGVYSLGTMVQITSAVFFSISASPHCHWPVVSKFRSSSIALRIFSEIEDTLLLIELLTARSSLRVSARRSVTSCFRWCICIRLTTSKTQTTTEIIVVKSFFIIVPPRTVLPKQQMIQLTV